MGINHRNMRFLQFGVFILVAIVLLGIGYAAISNILLTVNSTKTVVKTNQENFKVHFTEAQNKDGDNSDFDSIGAIVAFCEKEGGFIPRYVTDAPKDVIDIIIQDNKEYLQTLIHNDTNLSQQIEQFLKKKEILLQQKEDRKLAKLKGLDTVEVTDQDYADFYKAMKGGNTIEEEGDEDA